MINNKKNKNTIIKFFLKLLLCIIFSINKEKGIKHINNTNILEKNLILI